jgi:two-component system, NtrC family, nitrogen regulation response regulator GlnG
MTPRVLIADDDTAIRMVLQQALTREGFQVRATGNVATLAKWAQDGEGDLIVTDVYMGESCVFDALPHIRAQRPSLPIIVMSAQNTVATAMSAAGAGAYDYLPKPFDLDDLVGMARRALSQQPNARARAAAALAERDARLPMVGRSAIMQELYRAMARAASTELPLLIEGEAGVGKERIARAVHAHGRRTKGAFHVWRMAGEGPALTEHAPSHFALAAGGTLFLDGVEDLDLPAQASLLGLLEGMEQERPDFRLIASVNGSLDELCDGGRFRPDLALRLTVLHLNAPPLRAHVEDLGDIARALLAQAKAEGLPEKTIDPGAIEVLQRHAWPGNVRELWNVLRRVVAMRPDRLIAREDVEAEFQRTKRAGGAPADGASFEGLLDRRIDEELAATPLQPGLYDRLLAQVEKPLIERTLSATRGNQIKAAAILGINRNTLRKKILSLGVVTGKGD